MLREVEPGVQEPVSAVPPPLSEGGKSDLCTIHKPHHQSQTEKKDEEAECSLRMPYFHSDKDLFGREFEIIQNDVFL